MPALRSLRGYLLPLCLCCCVLPLLSACSFYNRLFHRSHDHGCSEKPFQGNSVELPGLTVPEGMTPPDKRNQVKIPTLTETGRVRGKTEPCLSQPPSYKTGQSIALPTRSGLPVGAPAPEPVPVSPVTPGDPLPPPSPMPAPLPAPSPLPPPTPAPETSSTPH
jgi:hypothetical protein